MNGKNRNQSIGPDNHPKENYIWKSIDPACDFPIEEEYMLEAEEANDGELDERFSEFILEYFKLDTNFM